MNTEISYIRNGILVTVAVLLAVGSISLLQHSRWPEQDSGRNPEISSPALSRVSASNQEGMRLFKTNCTACHSLYKDLTGPALAGVTDRWPSRALLKKWILNWSKAVATGNPYPRKMADWSPLTMNIFEGSLSDQDVESIINYLEEEGKKDRVVAYR